MNPNSTEPREAGSGQESSSLHPNEAGFGLVEAIAAALVLAVGLLGFMTMVTNSHVLSRSSREVDSAQVAIMSVGEEFRVACATDFEAALTTYGGGVVPVAPTELGTGAVITVLLLNDETKITPPIDLNGDNDNDDTSVSAAQARAGVLRVHIAWTGALGEMHLEYTTVVARGQLE